MASIQEQFKEVQGEVATAQKRINELTATWHNQCAGAMLGMAEATEEELTKAKKQVERLLVQQSALAAQIATADAAAAAAHAAGLAADANANLATLVATLDSMATVALQLANGAAKLEAEARDWTEAVHHARAAGAVVDGFSTQENDSKVSALTDSLARTRQVISGTATNISRFSVR